MTSQPVGDRDRSLVRLGVIGCGDWGCNHVRTLAQMGCLTSICDPDPERLARAAALAPAAGRYQTVAELVGAGVDGVIIATPAVTHRQVAEQVMRLGCDALVEKPLALSVAEAVDLAELAGELGRVLMVGHVLEYHPGLQAAFSLIHDGAIGRPLYAYSNRLNFGKVRTEESILWSFAPHDIALMLRLGGSSPVAVRAQSAALLRTGIPDVTVTHLDFPDLQTHIFVSWLHPFKEQRFVVVGADGMLSFDGVAGTLTHHHQSVAMEDGVPRLASSAAQDVPFAGASPLERELDDFIDCIITRRTPVADARSGIDVLRVIEACSRPAGSVLTIEPRSPLAGTLHVPGGLPPCR